MLYLASTSICNQLTHHLPVLVRGLVQRLVLEVEMLQYAVRSHLYTSLLVADGAFGADAHPAAHLFDKLFNISREVCTSIVALKGGYRNLVFHELLSTLWLCDLRGAVVKDTILNKNILAVDIRNWHHYTIPAALGSVTNRNDCKIQKIERI